MGGAHAPQASRSRSGTRASCASSSRTSRRSRSCGSTTPARRPTASRSRRRRSLRKHAPDLYRESDVYPNYEGRSGASAREIKTALFNAAQNPNARCLTPLAVLEELDALCRDKSVHDFLQQEVVDGYHDHEEFVRVVEADYLDSIDEEIRDSMGLVSEAQYRELFGRYVTLVSALGQGRAAAEPAHRR